MNRNQLVTQKPQRSCPAKISKQKSTELYTYFEVHPIQAYCPGSSNVRFALFEIGTFHRTTLRRCHIQGCGHLNYRNVPQITRYINISITSNRWCPLNGPQWNVCLINSNAYGLCACKWKTSVCFVYTQAISCHEFWFQKLCWKRNLVIQIWNLDKQKEWKNTLFFLGACLKGVVG